MSRAIVSQPAKLLLDEITANLDAETEQVILDALRNAAGTRTIISISTGSLNTSAVHWSKSRTGKEIIRRLCLAVFLAV